MRPHHWPSARPSPGCPWCCAGCGNSSLSSGDNKTSSAPAPTQTKAAALVAKLPAKIKSAGKIVVGIDATYAPNEFLAADGKTVQGMDVDLFNAVAQKLGVKVEWQPAEVRLASSPASRAASTTSASPSFTINAERKKQVNMVSYFNAGTQWATAKGNPKKVDPEQRLRA